MRNESRVDLFSKPAHVDEAPTTADGLPPRGLTPGGWVRTTGWLQVGDHPVSSSHLAAAAGLLWALVGGILLMARFPVAAGVLVIGAPVVCGTSWWIVTTRVLPASSARNIGTKPVGELVPGELVRLYGSAGPVGQVAEVWHGKDVRVEFHGGERRSWGHDRVVYLAELLS